MRSTRWARSSAPWPRDSFSSRFSACLTRSAWRLCSISPQPDFSRFGLGLRAIQALSRTTTAEPSAPAPLPVRVLYGIAFLSGAYVMTLENVLIRTTDLAVGPSTASFS